MNGTDRTTTDVPLRNGPMSLNLSYSPINNSDAQEETFSPPFPPKRSKSTRPRRNFEFTATLCLCMFCVAYLQLSMFPISGYMVIHLVPGVTHETAGTYSGILAASFMIGRTFSSYNWGRAADCYGRKFVLMTSLLLMGFFSFLFGTAQTFWQAWVSRFLLGMSEGIVSTVRTSAMELAAGDEALERRTVGLVLGIRSWGYLIGPGVAGFLAEPISQYPNSTFFRQFESLLTRYPFVLSIGVGSLMCILGVVSVFFFIDETLSIEKRRSPMYLLYDAFGNIQSGGKKILKWPRQQFSRCTLKSNASSTKDLELQSLLQRTEKGEHCSIPDESEDEEERSPIMDLLSDPVIRNHLQTQWMFSFVVMSIDESFPLFCISTDGGLGIAEAAVGKILCTAGILFAVLHYPTFAATSHRLGIYPTIALGGFLGNPTVVLIPLYIVVQRVTNKTWIVHAFLSLILAVCKIWGTVFFIALAIALNKAVGASRRATANGLAILGVSVSRALGPLFAGVLVAKSFSSHIIPPQFGSIVIFSTIASLGVIVALKAKQLEKLVKNSQISGAVQ